ncbi:MAG: CHASE2 domain-containing protein [Limisphaerales bacterium]
MSQRPSRAKAALAAIVVLVVAALPWAGARWPAGDGLNRPEWWLYDFRVRWAARSASDVKVPFGFVVADDDTVANFADGLLGEPIGLLWPRFIYGHLAEELAAQGATAVAFDMVFGERRMDHREAAQPDGTPVGSDESFAQAMRRLGTVAIGATEAAPPDALFLTNAMAAGDIEARGDADGVTRRFAAFREYRVWNPLLRQIQRDNQVRLERDPAWIRLRDPITGELLREVPVDEQRNFNLDKLLGTPPRRFDRLLPAYSVQRFWNLGIVLAAHSLGLDLNRADVRLDEGRILLPGTNGVSRSLPVDGHGRLYADWTVPTEDARLLKGNFESVLFDRQRRLEEPDPPPRRWDGRIVVVGSAATSSNLSDIGATPLGSETFQASGLWNLAQTVITGRFIRPPSPAHSAAFILACGALAFFLTARLGTLRAVLCVAAVAVLFLAAAFWLYLAHRWWLPVAFPLVSLAGVHGVVLAVQVAAERNERERVRAVFARLVSPEVVKEVLASERLALGGTRRRLTVFFADIRGFTELTDASEAAARGEAVSRRLSEGDTQFLLEQRAEMVLQTVNLYLATVADEVKRHSGTLDKYIGDCVMAFWGAPIKDAHHALHCVQSAIAAQRAIDALNRERAARSPADGPPLPTLQLGTGINTGVVTVGLVGSSQHILNYTAFGREVNLASRLESASGRARILISEATLAELRHSDPALAATCQPLEPVTMKGFREPVPVFEVPWRLPEKAAAAPAPAEVATGPAGAAR